VMGIPLEQGFFNVLFLISGEYCSNTDGTGLSCHVMTDSFTQVLSEACHDCSRLEHRENQKLKKKTLYKNRVVSVHITYLENSFCHCISHRNMRS